MRTVTQQLRDAIDQSKISRYEICKLAGLDQARHAAARGERVRCSRMRDVTLAILAGGHSSRMRASKANLEIGGKAVLQYLLDQAKWPGPTMLITAPGGERVSGSDRFDQTHCDPVAGVGPLRGILTA